MSTRKTTLIAVAILLFAIGAWPIALVLFAYIIFAPEKEEKTDKERIKELENEIKNLNQKLDEQFIEKVIQKTDEKKS